MRKILTDPAKLFTKITLGPSSNPVRPGATDYLTAPLRPGRWLLVDPQAGNDGTPKFAHGLAAETQVGG